MCSSRSRTTWTPLLPSGDPAGMLLLPEDFCVHHSRYPATVYLSSHAACTEPGCLLQGGHLRFVCHEYQWYKWACMLDQGEYELFRSVSSASGAAQDHEHCRSHALHLHIFVSLLEYCIVAPFPTSDAVAFRLSGSHRKSACLSLSQRPDSVAMGSHLCRRIAAKRTLET